MEFYCKPFSELTADELYDILALRCEVFVVEQNCVYQDVDGLDRECLHCFYYDGAVLAAYLRMIPPGAVYEAPAIGRFVSAPSRRKTGLGRRLMRHAIPLLFKTWDAQQFEISAQTYLLDFYRGEGFEPVGAPYLEDGIEHIHMIYHRR